VTKMMKQFDHMIERKLNLELSNVFPRLSNVFARLKFLAGCGQFSDLSNKAFSSADWSYFRRTKTINVLKSVNSVKLLNNMFWNKFPVKTITHGLSSAVFNAMHFQFLKRTFHRLLITGLTLHWKYCAPDESRTRCYIVAVWHHLKTENFA
jgi:hypothetical protein